MESISKTWRPLTYGKIKNRFFFGLPGNPVSTMITFIFFVLPLIYKMSGDELKLNYIDAITSTVLKKKKEGPSFNVEYLILKMESVLLKV
ncbi:MAG: hypothetical protein CM15mP93_10190 [Thiotrichaceae bacterium]|nr:MAG: hypothetical protein CM15mP93_10190 [Thiotrichaceae bacterium]